MREIKFRAWDKENKHMIYDIQTKLKIVELTYSSGKEHLYTHFDEYLKDDNFEIMQYISLKDINDKEIYESDFIKDQFNYIYKIIWDSNYCCFKGINIYDNSHEIIISELFVIEKIGNEYENSELMEGIK